MNILKLFVCYATNVAGHGLKSYFVGESLGLRGTFESLWCDYTLTKRIVFIWRLLEAGTKLPVTSNLATISS